MKDHPAVLLLQASDPTTTHRPTDSTEVHSCHVNMEVFSEMLFKACKWVNVSCTASEEPSAPTYQENPELKCPAGAESNSANVCKKWSIQSQWNKLVLRNLEQLNVSGDRCRAEGGKCERKVLSQSSSLQAVPRTSISSTVGQVSPKNSTEGVDYEDGETNK